MIIIIIIIFLNQILDGFGQNRPEFSRRFFPNCLKLQTVWQ